MFTLFCFLLSQRIFDGTPPACNRVYPGSPVQARMYRGKWRLPQDEQVHSV